MGEKIFKPPIKNATLANGRIVSHELVRGTLLVGRMKREYQALVQFDITSLPSFLTILQATLNLFLLENEDMCSKLERGIDVYQVLSPWYLRKGIIINDVPVDSVLISTGGNVFLSFDVTPLVIDWYTGNAKNFGLLLRVKNSLIPGLFGFSSNKSRNSTFWPSLQVSFMDQLPSERCGQTLDVDESVITTDTVQTTAALNIQSFDYTYFIINTGVHSATVSMQISPDGMNWITSEPLRSIHPGEVMTLLPGVLSRFARLTYQSTVHCENTSLDICVRGYTS